MKALKYFISAIILVVAVWNCTDEEFGSTDFIESATAPTNLTAVFDITQDNTGLVTITPNGEGANFYNVNFGDDTVETVDIEQGESIEHIYKEGNYQVKLIGLGITGLSTEQDVPLVVSFKAPENLEVDIENDASVSKQVNVTANADYATSFDVYYGEEGKDEPVTANIGDTASYIYEEVGTYTIRVVAKSAAIETLEYTEEFEVTAILQPVKVAPTPPDRAATDVVSIFSDVYENVVVSEWNPGWGQTTVLTNYTIDDDNILQYDLLDYTGIVTDYGNPTDLSMMQYVHFDYWTTDAESIGFKIVNTNQPDGPTKESEVVISEITTGEWVSIDIPLSDYTTNMSEITQMVFSSTGVTVFIDNLYFYKAPSDPVQLPLTFDSDAETFGTFNGATFEIVADPENANNQVGKITNSGSDWEGSSLNLDVPVDFSVNKQIKLKFNSTTTGNTVLLKMENGTDDPVEVSQSVSQIGWSEITFDFSAANYSYPNSGVVDAFGAYSTIVIFVDGGQATPGIYYIDDIEQSGGMNPGPSEIMDFEPGSAVYSWTGFGDANFGPIPADITANPDPSGINTSINVVAIDKLSGAQTWAGASTNLGGVADFSTGTTIKMKVWSPRVGTPILFKMEDSTSPPDANGNPTVIVEVIVNSTVANAWEELSFDLTTYNDFSASISYDNVIIFPDFNNAGNGELFYFDDITVNVKGSGTTPPSTGGPNAPIDFEDGGNGADWTWTVFENDSNPALEVVANPNMSGANTSSTVAKITALQNGQPWVGCESLHGADIGSFTFDASNSIVKIMVFKTVISDVGLKFAEASGDAQVEVKVANTKVNEWEELTFDLSGSIGQGATGVIDQIIIFPDFDLDGRTADNVVYFDNITFGSN